MRQTVYPMPKHSSLFAYTAAYDGKINKRPQTAVTKTPRRRPRALQKSVPQGNSTSFLSFIRRKAKKSEATSRLSARGARIRSRNDAAQQPRSAGDTAVVDTHCAGAGPPRLRRQTECAAPIRAESRFSHRRRREGRGRKHTRFRPSDADAGKAFSGIAPAPIARPRSDSRNAAGAERPPYPPAELFIDR